MILQTDYVDGDLSLSQIENLRLLAGFAPDWFLWGLPGEVDRLRKRPHNPCGGPGKVDDPSTAGTLDKALEAMRSKEAGGVGLLMSTVCAGLVGVDLDNVIAGDKMHALGLEAIKHFKGGYVELSPSGGGLRIFCRGELPAGTPKGSTAIVDGVKFEAYPAGTNRFLRTTGALIPGIRGEVVNCQAGLDWLAGVMIARKPGSPDNASVKGEGSGSLSLDAVFGELSRYRPDKDAEAVIEAIQIATGSQPRGKLADAYRGNVSPWKGDHSTADLFMACEVIRRGAGCLDDVVAVWLASGLGTRPKMKRLDYRLATVEKAARAVLASLRSKSGNDGKVIAAAAPLPGGLTEALALSGDKLTYSKGGRLEPTAGNVVCLFRNDARISGLLAFNEFAQCAERVSSWRVFDRLGCDYPGPLSDDDITRVEVWLAAEFGMKIRKEDLMRGLEASALDAKYDPLSGRLREMSSDWDGVSRVDSWLAKYGRIDTTGREDYVRAISRMFLIGAVARALSPGCKMDNVLSVEGAAGGGKSAMFKVLADVVALGLFADGVQDASNPVAIVEGTDGVWILELGELAAIRRASDVEALKSSITRTVEKIRRPYAAKSSLMPRRFVMVATTNNTGGYLADPSGALARRFWPVRTQATETQQIDLKGLREVAGQLWGEAVSLYLAGSKWHLSETDGLAFSQWVAGRDLRREDGAYFNELYDYLCAWVAEDPAGGRSLAEIARGVGDSKTADSGGVGAAAMQLAGTLTSMDMEKRKSGKSRWFFTTESANKFRGILDRSRRDEPLKAAQRTLRAA